ncbi:MAG: SCO family protein [Bacteriovoracaceae bacterium]|nr:SCO family protein [Bacteriovoracaceae bacterium]
MNVVINNNKSVTSHVSDFVTNMVQKKLFWVILVGFSFLTPIYRSVIRPLPEPPSVLFTVKNFTLLDENGVEFNSLSLAKKFTIVHFHFSSCPTICPEMLKTAQNMEKRVRGLGQSISILSVTIDPLKDTPEVLFPLARKHRANPFVWKFLTGTELQIQELLQSFKQSPVHFTKDTSAIDIVHSGSFFVMDRSLNVRGIYHNNVSEVNRMMIDIGLMINRI